MCADRGSVATPLEGWAKGVSTESENYISRSSRSAISYSRRHFLQNARSAISGKRSAIFASRRVWAFREIADRPEIACWNPVFEVGYSKNRAMRLARGKTAPSGPRSDRQMRVNDKMKPAMTCAERNMNWAGFRQLCCSQPNSRDGCYSSPGGGTSEISGGGGSPTGLAVSLTVMCKI